jgi:hypothetical protein
MVPWKHNTDRVLRELLFGGWSGRDAQFRGQASGFGRANALEDLQRLPQPGFSLGGTADGQGAPAQSRQGVRLAPGVAGLAS